MPTISFEITEEESSAIFEITKESAQDFLERNARVHVKSCVDNKKTRDFTARGVPSQVASALESDELEAIAQIRETKAAAKLAAVEAEKAASLAPK